MMASRLSKVAVVVLVAALVVSLGHRAGGSTRPGPTLPEGMNAKTAKAVERGLRWLANNQRANGSWLNTGGGYGGSYPAAMTSVAGVALLAGGSTPEAGPYARNVQRALEYTLSVAEDHDDGLIVGPGGESRSMYGHGFSLLFLAQCYGMENSPEREKRLKRVLDKAVKLTVTSQSKVRTKFPKPYDEAGGWIYTPTSRGDEGSVTITQLQALRACRNAGIEVPEKTIRKAVAYLRHCQNADGGISYAASSRGNSRPAISAAAVACFYAAGVYDRQAGGAGPEAKMVEKLVAYVKRTNQPEQNSGHWFYSQYYMAEAMYTRGGADWKKYYPRIRDRLLALQFPDGSWQGDSVGTVYGTALATTILQLPYGYLPIVER